MKNVFYKALVILFLSTQYSILFIHAAKAQTDTSGSSIFTASPTFNKPRLTFVAGTGSALYLSAFSGLYVLWYKDYPQSPFHLYNDNAEWLQMDKVGHFYTSYYIGKIAIDVLGWTGLERKKSILYGAGTGLLFQTTIEVMDGFSSGWGFSIGDMTANTLGSALVTAQALLWNEQRIQPRLSVHSTKYAGYRPEVLGSNVYERIFKDYNGQTLWLSGNISSFLSKESTFPKWLNLAAGYGIDGVVGGFYNQTVNKKGIPIPNFVRQRQFYLSLDIDLSRIKTKSKFLKTVFTTVGFLKVPMPALEWNSKTGGLKFYPLYF